MHTEDYEWVLYKHGHLSKRREMEIEAHLRCCDRCLAAYTKMMAGEEDQSKSPSERKKSFIQLPVKSNPFRWATLAAIIFVVFIGFSFMPGGKVAWANIRLSIESLGNSLSELFGVESDSPVITTVDQTAIEKEGVEMKIDQIFIETGQIYFSVIIASRFINENMPYSLQIGSSYLEVDEEEASYVTEPSPRTQNQITKTMRDDGMEVPTITLIMQAPMLKDYSQKENVSIKIRFDDVYYYREEGYGLPQTIIGPWEFNFTVDGTLLARETKQFPLAVTFQENEKIYEVQHLSISPVRTLLRVRRVNPLVISTYLDEQDQEQTVLNTSINLNGFLIQDQEGNQAEITKRETLTTEPGQAVFEFASDPAKNPYNWLKDAESITITPYVTSLGWKSDQRGIRRLKSLADGTFIVELKTGDQDEK